MPWLQYVAPDGRTLSVADDPVLSVDRDADRVVVPRLGRPLGSSWAINAEALADDLDVLHGVGQRSHAAALILELRSLADEYESAVEAASNQPHRDAQLVDGESELFEGSVPVVGPDRIVHDADGVVGVACGADGSLPDCARQPSVSQSDSSTRGAAGPALRITVEVGARGGDGTRPHGDTHEVGS
jgi:hypothetical protein